MAKLSSPKLGNRGERSVREIPIRLKGAACCLKKHFYGVVREVVGYMDKQAARRQDRFVFAAISTVAAGCHRYKGKRYTKRAVEIAILLLVRWGVLIPDKRKVNGVLRNGWVVVAHPTPKDGTDYCDFDVTALPKPEAEPPGKGASSDAGAMPHDASAKHQHADAEQTHADAMRGDASAHADAMHDKTTPEFAKSAPEFASSSQTHAPEFAKSAPEFASSSQNPSPKFAPEFASEFAKSQGQRAEPVGQIEPVPEKLPGTLPGTLAPPSRVSRGQAEVLSVGAVVFNRSAQAPPAPSSSKAHDRPSGADDLSCGGITVGDLFQHVDGNLEAAVAVASARNFDESYLPAPDDDLYALMLDAIRKAIRRLALAPFRGPSTNAQVMGLAMDILRKEHGLNMPKGWLPTMRRLREQALADPSSYRLDWLAFPDDDGCAALAAVRDYLADHPALQAIMVQLVNQHGAPGGWGDAIPFLTMTIELWSKAGGDSTDLQNLLDNIKGRRTCTSSWGAVKTP